MVHEIAMGTPTAPAIAAAANPEIADIELAFTFPMLANTTEHTTPTKMHRETAIITDRVVHGEHVCAMSLT